MMPFEESKRPAPPHSIEAEESVVGGILVHAKKLIEAAPIAQADDFYHPALRAIYEAMLQLDADSKPVDAVTVVEQMRALDTFEKLRAFNGGEYLTELMSKIVTAENIGHHARIVHQKAEARRWLSALQALVASGYASHGEEAWFEEAEQVLVGLNTKSGSASDVVPIKTAMSEFATELGYRVNRKKEGKSSIVGVTTGYANIDALLSGLRAGLLYVFAGRPGSGKSAYAMNAVEKSAKLGAMGWLVFSLEMARLELAQRMVSGNARIDGQRLSQGDVSGFAEWQRITGAVGRLADLPIWITDQANTTIAGIRSKARRWRMGAGAKFEHVGIVVDYMQLVEAAKKRGNSNREQDVSEISRGAKLLARELNCPVIALAQLNRGLEQRADKRPMLSDLRESGAIEQDADVVAFLYRDAMYHEQETCTKVGCDRCARHDVAEFIVAKQRSGPTGTVDLLWQGSYTRFESLSMRDEAA
jgi:replicative DNA helicase